MVGQAQELLRRLTANEEDSVRMVLALRPEITGGCGASDAFGAALTPRVRVLVRLAALVALDASTTSLRWAVELASSAGADDDEIVGVLTSVGPEVGVAQIVATAPRLALAIGYDVEAERLPPTSPEDPRSRHARPPLTGMPRRACGRSHGLAS